MTDSVPEHETETVVSTIPDTPKRVTFVMVSTSFSPERNSHFLLIKFTYYGGLASGSRLLFCHYPSCLKNGAQFKSGQK